MRRWMTIALGVSLFIGAGAAWIASRSASGESATPLATAQAAAPAEPEGLPVGDPSLVGAPPPMPAQALPATREQRRFNRYDTNRDGIISREEMMASRAKAFRKLDTDGNNLLSFEEWAVATGERFAGADTDKNGRLTAAEFATTAPKCAEKAKCKC